MLSEYLQKFGEELKKQREESNLSIDQIYTKTRIDKKYLVAIEEGNFSIMPEVYIRAFIKEYSTAIGLNHSDVLSKYEKVKKGVYLDEAEANDTSDQVKSDEKIETVEKKISEAAILDAKADNMEHEAKSNKTLYYSIAGIVLLLLIFIIYKSVIIGDNNKIIAEKPFDEIVNEQNGNIVTKEEAASKNETINVSDKIVPKNQDLQNNEVNLAQVESNVKNRLKQFNDMPLVLQIVGSEKSWIRVVTDEKDNTEFIIENNITKILGAQKKFYLHIGNSNGVRLILNNNDLNFTGAPGKVRKIFVTKSGIEYLERTPVSNEQGQN